MKSFNFISRPYRNALVIAAILLCSMAFRNPFSPKPGPSKFNQQNFQVADTVPKSDININIDLSKILADVDIALAKIDFEKMAQDIELSLEKIDFTKMQKEIDESLKVSIGKK